MIPITPDDDRRSPQSHATVFVVAVVSLSAMAVAAVLAVVIARPTQDNTSLIATILGFLLPVISALLAGAVQQVHLAVNGRLSQLVALTAKSSHAEGQLVGLGDASKVIDAAATIAAAKVDAAASLALATLQAAAPTKAAP